MASLSANPAAAEQPGPPLARAGAGARVFQNTVVLLAGRGAGVFLSAGAAVILARYLGSERLGQFGALYAYLSLFAWLAGLGIEPVLAREASRQRELAGSIMLTGVALCGLFGVGTALFAVLFAPLAGYSGYLQVLLVFAAIDLLVLLPLRLPGVIFQVDLKQWYGVGINVLRQVYWLGAVAVLAYLKAPLLYVVLGRSAGAVLEAALIWRASARFLAPPRRILTDRFKPYLRYCAPIAFSFLLASVYMRIDQVMLHKLASDRVLGGYVAAVKVSELFEMLPAAVLSSLFPILASAAGREPQFRGYVDRSFRYLMVLAGGLCVFITVGAKPIVALLYGAEFSPAAPLLAVLIWSEFAVFFGSVVVNALLAGNLQQFLLFPTAVGAGANVLLNLFLIPRYGALGAAWATLISYSLAWAAVLLAFARTRSLIWQGLRRAAPPVLLSLAVSVAALRLAAPAPAKVVIALTLYTAGVWGLRMIRREDLEYARGVLASAWPKPGNSGHEPADRH